MVFLGLDLGTSGLRALLLSADGELIASAEQHYDVSTPQPGWSEQDPALWLQALDAVMAELRRDCPAFSELRGIAVAGHMHGATLLDKDGAVLRPCILWNDTRSEQEAAELDAMPGVRECAGNIVFPGFTAPKLAWLRRHEAAVYGQVARVLLPAAYLNYHLTGDYVADMSDSAGTAWLDVGRRRWSQTLLKAGQMREEQMPRLVEGSQAAGLLRAELARRWGLKHEVVVAGGAGDNAAAACGIGALNEGSGFVSLGTSGVVLAARDGYYPCPETALHTFCHALPARWYQMGVMLSATNSLNWLAGITGQSPAQLTAALGDTLQGPGPVQFLPYLSGERTPHNDARVRGSLTGLATASGPAELTRAVLEGVSFGLRDSLEALRASGTRPDSLWAIGGGSASSYWLSLLATVFGIPLLRPQQGEFGAALGAARLAQVAATGAEPTAIMTPPAIAEVIEPQPQWQGEFDAAYEKFRSAYKVLKQLS
ncbi:xylulokinase [Granulosicoccaceae sp. 1_MG-2023]|nr:xylulokinase [Granulosicoccaceae sp. 1_MG-2023]